METKHYIYKATNNINNKVYIGQTKNLHRRKICHKYEAKTGNKLPHFYKAIRKYGFENFSWEVIYTASSLSESNDKEVEFIKLYNALDRKIGYNVSSGGKVVCDKKWTKKMRMAASKRRSGKNHPNYGKFGAANPNFIYLNENIQKDIVDLYKNGKSIDALVIMFGVNWNKIRSVLLENDVKIRTRKEANALLPQNNRTLAKK